VKLPPRKPKEVIKISTTLLIDGDSLLKTAYHGAKRVYANDEHVGGIFQFYTILRKLIVECNVDRVFIFWDGPESGKLRFSIYPEYKGNRKDYTYDGPSQDKSFDVQKIKVKQYAEELFIRQYEDITVEADDCIAFYCANRKENEKIIICSNDRDLCQLLNDSVSIYLLDRKKVIDLDNYHEFFDHHPANAMLIKMIEGCDTDNIKGVVGVAESTLLKHVPELRLEKIDLPTLLKKVNDIQEERVKQKQSRLKALDNLLTGKTKGSQKDRLFEINQTLVDLSHPLITEECIEHIIHLMRQPIDPEGRDINNAIRMLMEDGIFEHIPGGKDGYIEFLMPFKKLIEKEKKEFTNKKELL